jgi:hypothetical protein
MVALTRESASTGCLSFTFHYQQLGNSDENTSHDCYSK